VQDIRGVPRHELIRAAASVAAIVVGIALLGWIAGLVLVGHSGAGLAQPLDDAVRRWVAAHSSTTNPIAVALDALFGSLGCIVIAAVAGTLVWWRTRRLFSAVEPFIAALASGVVVFVVKAALARPRPSFSNGTPIDDYSFPSGHATSTAAIAVAMALVWLPPRWRRAGFVASAVGIGLVALSRLVLGVHWFTDVVVGVALGVALAVAIVHACAPLVRDERDPGARVDAASSRST